MADFSISYDLLFDLLRYEKSREELQSIDESFYRNVFEYLQTKESSMINSQTPVSERELTRIQLNNVKKLLLELYERREKKIIHLAMYKLKTGSDAINTNNLLPEERPAFDAIYSLLNRYRTSIISNLLNNNAPYSEEVMIVSSKDFNPNAATLSANKTEPKAQDASITQSNKADGNDEYMEIKSIRFIKPVPRFLGPELETYGPFEQDEIASLPSSIARILVNKERAEEIHID